MLCCSPLDLSGEEQEAEHKGCSHARLRRRPGAHRGMAWSMRCPHRLHLLEDSAISLLLAACTHRCAGQGCTATFLLRFPTALAVQTVIADAIKGGRQVTLRLV